MSRYIGLDVHKASTTMVVVGPSGKQLAYHVVPTSVHALLELIKAVSRPRYLCFEEGTQSAWLYENLLPHVDELTVAGFRQERRGPKNDHRDALKLAQDLRTNSIDTRVFKDVGRYGLLRELVRAYRMQTGDSVRLQNRIKALYRSRGVSEASVLPPNMQPLADLLLREHDVIQQLRAQAQKQMLKEAKRHREVELVQTIPGIGAIRAAQLVAVIVSPHRFRTKRQLWTYAGFAVVTHSSSDWAQDRRGNWYPPRCAEDARTEPQPQPDPQGHLQGCRQHRCRAGQALKPALPSLREADRERNKAHPGGADHRSPDRGDFARRAQETGGIRSEQARNQDLVACPWVVVAVATGNEAPSRRQHTLGRVGIGGEHPNPPWSRPRSKSPSVGYAPPECRTKRWATESHVEGWFPRSLDRVGRACLVRAPGAEQTWCNESQRPAAAGCDQSTPCPWLLIATCSRLSRRKASAFGCQTDGPRGEVCLDTHPRRRGGLPNYRCQFRVCPCVPCPTACDSNSGMVEQGAFHRAW